MEEPDDVAALEDVVGVLLVLQEERDLPRGLRVDDVDLMVKKRKILQKNVIS